MDTATQLLLLGKRTALFSNYLNTLGTWLYSDGTLNGSAIKNFGLGGSGLDGAATAVTIDANGMNFNGTTSIITVTSDATMQTWTPSTFFGAYKASSAGEGSAGVLYCWGNTINEMRLGGAGSGVAIDSIISREDTNSTDARCDTTAGLIADEWVIVFRTFDNAGDRKVRVYRGIDGVVAQLTDATAAAGTGTLAAKSGAFHIGNRTLADRTFAGAIKFYGWIPSVISTTVMEQITVRSGL